MTERCMASAMVDSTVCTRRKAAPSISIVIKALNEEAKIARCIESALAALAEVQGDSEVILADSASNDQTVEIARRYPITIVQLANPAERGCGTGVQLGYQHSQGDFVMLLDGDMELLPGFLTKALARFAVEPTLAGVAGLLEETSIVNEFDRVRVSRGASNRPLRSARWLNGGGLYRRSAISSAGGYAADRNLKSWEEAELGMRLKAAGWTLERINYRSTLHTGHSASTGARLRSAWANRRAMANGVVIKQSIGKPWMSEALSLMLPPIVVLILWVAAFVALGLSIASQDWRWISGFGLVLGALAVVLILYKGSLSRALITLGMIHYMAAALLRGLLEPIQDPTAQIASVDLSPPSSGRAKSSSHGLEPRIERSIVSAASLTVDSR